MLGLYLKRGVKCAELSHACLRGSPPFSALVVMGQRPPADVGFCAFSPV